jgi:predicted GH43/DUF377 family glycosyl hydrolase
MNSNDGTTWPAFMSGNDQMVLNAQGQPDPEGDGYYIRHACVLHESNSYVAWYTVENHPAQGVGGSLKIWRAESVDGTNWGNRVLSLPHVSNTWEAAVGWATVVKEDDGTYTMFYAADTVGSLWLHAYNPAI